MFLYVNCCKEHFSRFTTKPQSVCVSIVTGRECTQTVYSNEPAMLVLENQAFLLFVITVAKHYKKNFFKTQCSKIRGSFCFKAKDQNELQ